MRLWSGGWRECQDNCCGPNVVNQDWGKRMTRSIENEKSIFAKFADIQSIEMQRDEQGVNAIPKHVHFDDGMETVAVTVDSGAYHTVGPPRGAAYFPIKPTESSKAGKNYSAANGSVIRNFGQGVITGKNDNGSTMTMPIQVAEVNRVLGSAREMVESGNRVVLGRDSEGKPCSYVLDKAPGHKTAIYERNGTFQFDLKVPKGRRVEAVGAATPGG